VSHVQEVEPSVAIWGFDVNIAFIILDQYPDLNEAQREIVGHADGPSLAVAGRGSGRICEQGI